MKRIILFIILYSHLHCNASAKTQMYQTQGCINKTVNVSNLKENLVMLIPFYNGNEVWIYKRNSNQKLKVKSSKRRHTDLKIVKWWPQDSNPIDINTSKSITRSKNDDYFVVYPYSPAGGYYLMYFSEKENASEQYDYLNDKWEGGFVDVVNQIAYDFTGRPIIINLPDTATSAERELSNQNLMIPKHEIDTELKTVTLLCK